MYKIIIALSISALFSCKVLNPQKVSEKVFKEKFNYATSTAKIINLSNNIWILEFYYNDNRYIVTGNLPDVYMGGKYEIIFDIANPEKNYLILWHKPIKPKSVKPEKTIGKLTYLKKYNDYVIIEYKFRHVVGRNNKERKTEQVPLKFYDDLKRIYETDKNIVVDIFYVKYKLNSKYVVGRPFLNYPMTLELQNSKNE